VTTIERQHYVQRLSRLVQIDEMTIGGRVQAAARTRCKPTRSTALAPANARRHPLQQQSVHPVTKHNARSTLRWRRR
jgi:hypothetical protein